MRITNVRPRTDMSGRNSRWNTFHANIDPAERIDDEKLDVTAPTIAARPSRPITGGTAYLKINGSASAGCAASRSASAGGHAYANATSPISSGGIVSAIVINPDRIECACAALGVRHDSTRWK